MVISFGAVFVPPLVLPHTDISVHNCQQGSNDGRDGHNREAGIVLRGVGRLEEEGAGYIACEVLVVEGSDAEW